MMSVTCKDCHARWAGARVEHCTADGCHETFAATRAGDGHRTGSFTSAADPRRCRTPQEMTAGGMWTEVNDFGTLIWHGEWNRKGQQRRRTSDAIPRTPSERPDSTSRKPEQGSGVPRATPDPPEAS